MTKLTTQKIKVILDLKGDFPNERTLEIGTEFVSKYTGEKVIITEENQDDYSFPFAIIDEQGEILMGLNPNFTDYSLEVISEEIYVDERVGSVTYHLRGDFTVNEIDVVLDKIKSDMFNSTILLVDHMDVVKVYECAVEGITVILQAT